MIYPLQAKAVPNSLWLQKSSFTVTLALMGLHLFKKLISITFFMRSSAFKEGYAHLRYSYKHPASSVYSSNVKKQVCPIIYSDKQVNCQINTTTRIPSTPEYPYELQMFNLQSSQKAAFWSLPTANLNQGCLELMM